jgi:hypothetical protein
MGASTSQPYGLVQPVTGIALPFTFYTQCSLHEMHEMMGEARDHVLVCRPHFRTSESAY